MLNLARKKGKQRPSIYVVSLVSTIHTLIIWDRIEPAQLFSRDFSGGSKILFTSWERRGRKADLRIKGREQEVEQQADGLLHVDLMGRRHPLVELVEDG